MSSLSLSLVFFFFCWMKCFDINLIGFYLKSEMGNISYEICNRIQIRLFLNFLQSCIWNIWENSMKIQAFWWYFEIKFSLFDWIYSFYLLLLKLWWFTSIQELIDGSISRIESKLNRIEKWRQKKKNWNLKLL